MLLWSLPSGVRRMASVMSLPTCFDTASTTPFFCADDRLIDDVQSVGFLLCLRLCVEGREDGFAGCCQKCVHSFLCRFENRSSHDCIGRLYSCEYVVAIVEKLYHAFARVTWVILADEDTLDAFLE